MVSVIYGRAAWRGDQKQRRRPRKSGQTAARAQYARAPAAACGLSFMRMCSSRGMGAAYLSRARERREMGPRERAPKAVPWRPRRVDERRTRVGGPEGGIKASLRAPSGQSQADKAGCGLQCDGTGEQRRGQGRQTQEGRGRLSLQRRPRARVLRRLPRAGRRDPAVPPRPRRKMAQT